MPSAIHVKNYPGLIGAHLEGGLGQIDQLDLDGQVVQSWKLRSPRCTIGSGIENTIILDGPAISALHASLTIGKRYTLLKALAQPTKIGDRNVREWLIDSPTHVEIGNARLIIYPASCAIPILVPGEQIDRCANRLRTGQQQIASRQADDRIVEDPVEAQEELFTAERSTLNELQDTLRILQGAVDSAYPKIQTEVSSLLTAQIAELNDRWIHEWKSSVDRQLSEQSSSASQIVSLLQANLLQLESTIRQIAGDSRRDNSAIQFLVEQTQTEQLRLSQRIAKLSLANTDVVAMVAQIEGTIRQWDAPRIVASNLAHEQPQPNTDPYFTDASPQYAVQQKDWPSEVATSAEYSDTYTEYPEQNLVEETLYDEEPIEEEPIDEDVELEGVSKLPAWFTDSDAYKPDQASSSNDPFSVDTDTDPDSSWNHVTTEDPNESSVEFESSTSHDDLNSNHVNLNSNSWLDEPIESSSPVSSVTTDVETENNDDDESISSRLERLLLDATERRKSNPLPPKTNSTPRLSSERLSQRFANATKELPSDSRSSSQLSDENVRDAESIYNGLPEDDIESSAELDALVHEHRNTIEASRFLPDPSEIYAESDTNSIESLDAFRSTEEPIDEFGHNASVAEEDVAVEEQLVHSAPAVAKHHRSNDEPSEDGEESIEDYMQRLLQRVRGGTAVEPQSIPRKVAAVPSTPIPNQSPDSPAPELDPVIRSQVVTETNSGRHMARIMTQRQAPEAKSDLEALRELANSNARRAINRSDQRRNGSAFLVKLAVSTSAMACSLTLLYLNGLQLNAPFAGMVAGIVVSLLWGYDCLLQLFFLSKNKRRHDALSNEAIQGGVPRQLAK